MGCTQRPEQIQFETALPVGTVVMHAGALPSGWLECDGSVANGTTYSKLKSVIGVVFGDPGAGDFNLPDLRGRTPIGLGTGDAASATAWTMAEKAGDEVHTLTTGETPAHTHALTNGGAHPDGALMQSGGTGGLGLGGGADDIVAVSATESAGGGGSHNNMQPVLGLRMIIFAGA